MWKRLRRRTMGPRRPVLFPVQHGLAVLTVAVLVASSAFALYAVLR
jgi:hypothetical protein